jgi:two-component system alkaline phosphatase synthesis response regulator PhoP
VNPRILIVEDDNSLRKLFAKALEVEHYRVVAVQTAEEALACLSQTQADLVLSDVVLQGKNGMTLCRELRSRKETARLPIVLISGRRIEEDDQVQGLDAGADDYLLKPVSGKILAAKIQSVLRRYRAPRDLEKILKAHGLTLDVPSRIATLRGQTIALTRKEFDLLTAFLRHPGRVLTNDNLLEQIWGVDPTANLDTHTLRVHISSLKKKLGNVLGGRIANVPRLGYRFEN